MAFTFTQCDIDGLWEIQPKVFGDARGYFMEAYSEKDFFEAGLTMRFVQDNQSASKGGVLRGLHWQTKHPQGKLVRALQGKVYDVAVDLRNDSPTFGKYHGVILDSEKQNMFYIPEGFAHGFYVLSDFAVFTYKCTDFYHPEDDAGLMWNDPKIGIDWNTIASQAGAHGITPLLSEKDQHHPAFNPDRAYFDTDGIWIGGDWKEGR
ncbi:MAG: dTDP-4-dehydrorhamnose 3,5-epimerase [Treponema sp.]|jgi:dTDP-4-dehydrorhamnose 3,5-epimerase|nr:dTDP-4-dehydrorhamnose 3,5-epimerase [Treponema sp.]MBR4464366.1 dTDP-4-dehydrorhamnose 3,5-epimerase [Treponema sp.]